MKTSKSSLIRALALAVAVMLLVPASVLAKAGDTVTNYVSISYDVGSTPQAAVTNSVSFLVDRKADVSVSVTSQNVTPNTNRVLCYRIDNPGNDNMDVKVDIIANSGATLTLGSVAYYLDKNDNCTYESGTDTAISSGDYLQELAPGLYNSIIIFANIPASATDGQLAGYIVNATMYNGGDGSSVGSQMTLINSTGADDPTKVDTVVADGTGVSDGSRDGIYGAYGQFKVVSALLNVTKTAAIVNDPVNSTTNPKAIPGAVIEYIIKVSNGGTSPATNVTVTDYLSNSASYTNYNQGTISTNSTDSPAWASNTDASDSDPVTWSGAATNTITVSGITISNGKEFGIKFRVTVE